ncbi:MAG: glycosyltransferase [Actinomycetota bacterium]
MIQRSSIARTAGTDDSGRTRVLLLIKGLGRGGAEQILVNTVRCGDDARFAYHVAYLLPWKDAFVPELQELGVPVDCLDGAKGLAWVGRLKRLLRERGIDVIHVHSPYVAAVVRGAVGRSGPLVVTTEHNEWDRYHRATYWANTITFPRNDYVFSVSREVEASIRYPKPLGFLHRPHVETLHHGIDVERVMATPQASGVREELGIPADALVVGTVANFKPHKGYEHLLQVAARVVRRRSDVRFVLVGGGPLQEGIRRQARELGIEGSVVFAGFRPDALRVMRTFDLYAMASVYEGLPQALIEATALGCPVVATRVGGVTAVVVEGENGFIVDARDTDTQADRITALLDDASLRQRFGEAARAKASSFDVRTAVRRIEQVYAELAA